MPKKNQPPLADRLRQAMRESGLTQFEIAKATDTFPSGISRFLNGGSLRIETAERIMDLLGFEVVGPKQKRRS